MAREALGIAGAAAGFIISGGNPMAAQAGFAIGYGIGSYLDPIKVPHPGLGDSPVQTGRDNIPIPLIRGLEYCHGNKLQKNPEVVTSTWERQGKGGSTKVEKKTRTRTYAIGICEGPISAIIRVWQNGQLVYDVSSSPAISAAESAKWLENKTFYLGTGDQMPDPDLEAHWGSDDTPAYRGLCYMVAANEDLTDVGGSIYDHAFEVQANAPWYGCSHPYAYEYTEATDAGSTPEQGKLYPVVEDATDGSATPEAGLLGAALVEYTSPDEATDGSAVPEAGLLGAVLVEYTVPDDATEDSATPENGILNDQLVQYIIPDEATDGSATPEDGTLT